MDEQSREEEREHWRALSLNQAARIGTLEADRESLFIVAVILGVACLGLGGLLVFVCS